MDIQLSYMELRQKEVINVCDGKRLGRIIDMVFDLCGKISGVVVPGPRRFFWWRSCEDIFIPWRKIDKIGNDVILVDLNVGQRFYDDDRGCPPVPPALERKKNYCEYPQPRRKEDKKGYYNQPPHNSSKKYVPEDYVLHKTGKSIQPKEEEYEDSDQMDGYPEPMHEP